LKDSAETPSIATPHPEVTPKRGGGLCTTLTNIFSPGGTKPKDSPSSDSSATYVDPDLAERIVGEGTEETTDPNVDTLKDSTSDNSNLFRASGDNSTEDVPLDGEVIKEHTIISVEEIKTNASTKGMIPRNEGTLEAIASDPSEDLIAGNGDDESMPQDGSSNTVSEEWTTVLDRRIKRKNKKAHKNKEKQQKKQAKQLRRQAKHGPAWAHQGGVLPSSSDSANGSSRHSSSDSNQNSQSQEIRGDGSNSNGSSGDQGERSDAKSRADPQSDPNLSGESQGGGDDETKNGRFQQR
jgi:hypothetical protein